LKLSFSLSRLIGSKCFLARPLSYNTKINNGKRVGLGAGGSPKKITHISWGLRLKVLLLLHLDVVEVLLDQALVLQQQK